MGRVMALVVWRMGWVLGEKGGEDGEKGEDMEKDVEICILVL